MVFGKRAQSCSRLQAKTSRKDSMSHGCRPSAKARNIAGKDTICVKQPRATRQRGYPSVNSWPKRRRAAGLKAVSHAHQRAKTTSAGVPTPI